MSSILIDGKSAARGRTTKVSDGPEPGGAAPGYREAVEAMRMRLLDHNYLADDGLATAVHLALSLPMPLLLEGDAGVGKTEVARVLAAATGRRLLRLQCYEGIDATQALYEWDHARQILASRTAGDGHVSDLFSAEFLVERPVLAALRAGGGAVLLVDELDRADDEFEAFLLEVLSDFAITIPELGPVAAESPPAVVITSNRTRELHAALKRRCLYHWIDHPTLEREIEIVRLRLPGIDAALAEQVAAAAGRLRALELAKVPGVAETIGWAAALRVLGVDRLDVDVAGATLGTVVKDHDDQEFVRRRLPSVVGHG
jgi:MoxR-like ATPase